MKSSLNHNKKFVFGSFVYNYNLVRQNRKTLSLTVAPDLKIYVKCPNQADDERIELFLRRKWFWLEKQLSFFRKYQRKTYQKEYVSGESFFYLGRQYKLFVKPSNKDTVLMLKGRLVVFTTQDTQRGQHTKKLLDEWYQKRTERVFNEQYKHMKSKFAYNIMPALVIREMQKRWGSFLNNGRVVLNPKLIHTSRDCIDYVIVHELCHVKYKNHNHNFYALLKKQYPKWEKVKDKLEIMGAYTK